MPGDQAGVLVRILQQVRKLQLSINAFGIAGLDGERRPVIAGEDHRRPQNFDFHTALDQRLDVMVAANPDAVSPAVAHEQRPHTDPHVPHDIAPLLSGQARIRAQARQLDDVRPAGHFDAHLFRQDVTGQVSLRAGRNPERRDHLPLVVQLDQIGGGVVIELIDLHSGLGRGPGVGQGPAQPIDENLPAQSEGGLKDAAETSVMPGLDQQGHEGSSRTHASCGAPDGDQLAQMYEPRPLCQGAICPLQMATATAWARSVATSLRRIERQCARMVSWAQPSSKAICLSGRPRAA